MKLLNLDIEVGPALVYTWDLKIPGGWLSPDKIVQPKRMLCFAGKWVGAEDVYFFSEWDDGRDEMLERIWDLLNEADAVLHFNGKRFDVPWLNSEFAIAGMPPPSPYQQIDLYRTVTKNFAFMSNKLGEVAKTLGTARKLDNEGFSLWVRVLEGEPLARLQMEEYNVGDVFANEDLYERVRPWIPNHPSYAVIDGEEDGLTCPQCGGQEVEPRGVAYTALSRYPRYLCLDCGKWLRGGHRISGAELRAI